MDDKAKADRSARTDVRIAGMHCANCELLVEKRMKTVPGVRRVKANYRKGRAEIVHAGPLDLASLQRSIADDGYTASLPGEGDAGDGGTSFRDYAEIAAVFIVLLGVGLVLAELELLPTGITVSENMSYGLVFLIGLVASVSSCIAVTGGLLVAVAAKYSEANPGLSGWQRWKTHIAFNIGRIASYTLLGGVIGLAGSALMLSPQTSATLTIAAAVVMILLGLQMLRLFPSFGRLMPSMPKAFAHRIHDLAAGQSKGGAFLLGALTFFLPCGFTQALQIYVLSKGSFTVGALTMLVFALGTLPALLSLSAITSFARGAFQKHFMRLAGAAVIMLGILNIQYGLVLADTGTPGTPAPQAVGNTVDTGVNFTPIPGLKQTVSMKVVGFEYIPNQFVVKAGIPVEWRIDGQEAAGCGRLLFVYDLGIREILSPTDTTVIAFTPTETGELAFNCGMGMMTPDSKFTVVPNSGSRAAS